MNDEETATSYQICDFETYIHKKDLNVKFKKYSILTNNTVICSISLILLSPFNLNIDWVTNEAPNSIKIDLTQYFVMHEKIP